MFGKRLIASVTGIVVILTMSCCASLQAAMNPPSSTVSHACCEKDKEKDKKKEAPKDQKQHNCQCDAKLVQVAEQSASQFQHFLATEVPAIVLFEISPLMVSQSSTWTVSENISPPAVPLLRLHCILLI